MKRLLTGLVVLLFSVDGYSVPDFEAIVLEQSGRVVRGGAIKRFMCPVSSDTTESITSITITCSGGTHGVGGNNVFQSNGTSGITNIKLYADTDGNGTYDDEILGTNDIDTSATSTATFTGSFSINNTTTNRIYVEVYLANEALLATTFLLGITQYIAGGTTYELHPMRLMLTDGSNA